MIKNSHTMQKMLEIQQTKLEQYDIVCNSMQ